MSEVKRYRLDPESCAAEHPQGDLVDYHEYARLKAEVERLRKAGDTMRWLIECQNDDAYYGHNEELSEAVKTWNVAKEGKPSV